MPGTRTLKSISVDLEVMTSDRLRKIVFGLDKATADAVVTWTIDFRLFEREQKTVDFGDPIVKLAVEVQAKYADRAEVTAQKGLSTAQVDHLLGPALRGARRLAQGELAQEKVEATVERTLAKRDG